MIDVDAYDMHSTQQTAQSSRTLRLAVRTGVTRKHESATHKRLRSSQALIIPSSETQGQQDFFKQTITNVTQHRKIKAHETTSCIMNTLSDFSIERSDPEVGVRYTPANTFTIP
jgi:hypothetical protein